MLHAPKTGASVEPSRNAEVEQAVLRVQASEARLQVANSDVQAKVSAVEGAAQDVRTAEINIQVNDAKNRQEDATADLARITAAREAVKNNVKSVLGLVKGIFLFGQGATATVGAGSGNLAIGGRNVSVSNSSDIIGIVAERIVNAAYADEIADAQAALDAAIADVRRLVGEAAASTLQARQIDLQTAQRNLITARTAVTPLLIDRRAAYSNLAQVAARRSGGSSGTQSRIAGIIAAIPIAEVVVSRASGVIAAADSALNISYTANSGIGFNMAMYAGYRQANTLVQHISWLSGMRDQFVSDQTFWDNRLRAMQTVVTQLAGGIRGSEDSNP
jgi:hypothetical protein